MICAGQDAGLILESHDQSALWLVKPSPGEEALLCQAEPW